MPANHPGPHPVDVACRANLRRLREHRGWSLDAAGRRLGIRPGTLGTYERHSRQLTVEQARRLAAGYGVSLGELLDPLAVVMLVKGLRPSLNVDEPADEPEPAPAAVVDDEPVQVIDLVSALQGAVERAHAARHAEPAAAL